MEGDAYLHLLIGEGHLGCLWDVLGELWCAWVCRGRLESKYQCSGLDVDIGWGKGQGRKLRFVGSQPLAGGEWHVKVAGVQK